MHFTSSARRHAGRTVRLGYCLNLHPSESLDDVRGAIDGFVVPLAARLGAPGPFGVGLYLGAEPARALSSDDAELARFATFLGERGVAPFTFNAFPYGGFQVDGLKAAVYAPDWTTEERLAYTVDVARVAAALHATVPGAGAFVSISTHPGAYGALVTDRSMLRRCAENVGRAVGELVRIEERTGVRIVLSVEAEPDASARNTRAAAETLVFTALMGGRTLQDEFGLAPDAAADAMRRHLGTCLDCCHSAVEFEDASVAVDMAATTAPLGKIQFSSALALERPAIDGAEAARDALFAMDEPRFLHQVTARGPSGFVHLPDLSDLRAAFAAAEPAWIRADEWRCHFHVPVHLETFGVEGAALGTTRAHADAVLAAALEHDAAWFADELHVEIETYTWGVLRGGAHEGDSGSLVDGLAAEYGHVVERLGALGWSVARSAADGASEGA